MFKKSICIVILLAYLIAPCVYGEELRSGSVIPLSLKGAVILTYKNNKDIQMQEKQVATAKADVLLATSSFLPKVNAEGSFTHRSDVPATASTHKRDGGVFTGYKSDNQVALSVDQSVFTGGYNIANFRQAKLKLTTEEQVLRSKKLEVEFEAKRLYWGLLLAFETERIAQDLFDQAKLHYEDVKNRYEQGTSSRFDLLQSKVQVSKLVPELVNAKNSVNMIMADLNKLLGLEVQSYIKPQEKFMYYLIKIDEAGFLKLAYLDNPDMVLKSLGVDINKLSINMARSYGLPQIGADLNYEYRSHNTSNIFNKRHNIWDAGISVSVPIFDGFSTKAKVDAAKAKYGQSILDKENTSDQIAVDIRQACLDLKKAEAIINSQKDNVEEAKEALRLSIVSYDNGVGTNLDVIDSQVSLSQIEKNLSEGIYDYIMAVAYLDKITGKEFLKEDQINEEKD